MARDNLVIGILKETGLYSKSLLFFLTIGVFVYLAFLGFHSSLQAEAPLSTAPGSQAGDNSIRYTLADNGYLYLGNVRQSPEVFEGASSFRYRLQVIDSPKDTIDQLVIIVTLPKAGNDSIVSHHFISNGGAATAESELSDPQTITYTATTITPQAKLAIEFEVPKSFVQQTALFKLKQRLATLPPAVWTIASIALPSFTLLVLLVMALARYRSVEKSHESFTAPPSRLSPALLGILLRGRITTRELAATFIDLARRGHLVIRQIAPTDFRFRRQMGSDHLEDFEAALLEQIFGPTSAQTSTEEINLVIAQELFSKKISQAFSLAYKKMNDLGYFYTNPLTLHRRYQLTGAALFLIGLVGFLVNIFLITNIPLFLLFWLGMMVASVTITSFARNLPSRTIYGDRELSRWLSFRQYLIDNHPISYAAQSQEKYLAYLPYSIILEIEEPWTRRFYSLPFIQPSWYVAANVSTIEDFTNHIFPLFGYLSHALSLSAQPASR